MGEDDPKQAGGVDGAEIFKVQQSAAMLERWDDDRMDTLATEVTGVGRRVEVLEVKVDGLGAKMDARFELVDERFKQVDERFKQVDERFKQVDERFDQVDRELLEQRREVKAGLERLGDRFDRLHRGLFGAATAIVVALLTAPHL